MKSFMISKVETVKFYKLGHFNDPINIQHVTTLTIGSGLHESNKVYDIEFKMVNGASVNWIYKDVETRNAEYKEIKANFGYMLGEGGFW